MNITGNGKAIIEKVSPLHTIKVGPKLWILLTPQVWSFSDGTFIAVEEFFVTDGASNWRFLWNLCPPASGATAEGSVLHDYLYSKDCLLSIDRKEADSIYNNSMKFRGAGNLRRAAVYRGVRTFGKTSFKACNSWEKLTREAMYPEFWELWRIQRHWWHNKDMGKSDVEMLVQAVLYYNSKL